MYLTTSLLVLIISLFQGPALGPEKVDERESENETEAARQDKTHRGITA